MKSNSSKMRKARLEPRRAVFCPPSYMFVPYIGQPPYYNQMVQNDEYQYGFAPPMQQQAPAQVFPQLSDQIDISLPSFAPDSLFDYTRAPSYFGIVDRNRKNL